MTSLLAFITDAVDMRPDLAAEFSGMGAVGIIMAAMNANSTSETLLAAAGAALKALGAGPEVALLCAKEVDRL